MHVVTRIHAVSSGRRGSKTLKKDTSAGSAKLKAVAKDLLDKNLLEIAGELERLAKEGNVPILRLLVELSNGSVGSAPDSGEELVSLADQLASEMEGETAAGQAETAEPDES